MMFINITNIHNVIRVLVMACVLVLKPEKKGKIRRKRSEI